MEFVIEPKVKLLSYTKNGLQLIYSAFKECYNIRSSYDEWEKHVVTDKNIMKKFIRSVLESGHTSPIEHVSFTFAIDQIDRSVSHQIVRHRIASYSQKSQRYVDHSTAKFILPKTISKSKEALDIYKETLNQIVKSYQKLVDLGIPKEDARYLLPNATQTSLVMTMNCRSLLHFFELRCCQRAQWGIREVANKMLKLCRQILPEIFENAGAFCDIYGYCHESPKFSCKRYPTLAELLEK